MLATIGRRLEATRGNISERLRKIIKSSKNLKTTPTWHAVLFTNLKFRCKNTEIKRLKTCLCCLEWICHVGKSETTM